MTSIVQHTLDLLRNEMGVVLSSTMLRLVVAARWAA